MDVLQDLPPILVLPQPVVPEPSLPDTIRNMEVLSSNSREGAVNATHNVARRGTPKQGDNDMVMVRHYHVPVELDVHPFSRLYVQIDQEFGKPAILEQRPSMFEATDQEVGMVR